MGEPHKFLIIIALQYKYKYNKHLLLILLLWKFFIILVFRKVVPTFADFFLEFSHELSVSITVSRNI